jgi:hypothetical protein
MEFAEQQNKVAWELGLNPSTVTRRLQAASYDYYRYLAGLWYVIN